MLIAQPSLMHRLRLTVNKDIRGRITYSVTVPRLNPDDGAAGNAIDFLVKLQGKSFSEAMRILTETAPCAR